MTSIDGTGATGARKVSLTGIQATGTPHLGNYVGAIRPALALAQDMTQDYESLYFIADYHALNSIRDPQLLRENSRAVAATWLAAGLDPDRTVFYRQSDIPEIFELQWALACLTAKGLMNRAHAYKAARDRNQQAGTTDLDAGVNMGLFNYPVLMAADILIMGSDVVPVGRDQIQHVEAAADIAGAFNAVYGERYRLKIPQVVVPPDESGQTLPGTDGRKMSKSYGNTIPLFAPAAQLRKLVRRIPTDSTPAEAPKDPDASAVFRILTNFAPEQLAEKVREQLTAGGLGWGELKEQLFAVLDEQFAPLRDRYSELVEPGSELDAILEAGAQRARERARPVLAAVRGAVGIG